MNKRCEEIFWQPRQVAAALIGLTAAGFDTTVRQRIGAEHIRGNGRELRYWLPAVHEARLAQKLEDVTSGSDPLLAGGADSPALEEYRREKTLLTRMERMEREGALIPRDELEPALFQYGGLIRTAGERLAREFGNAAAEILNDALDEYSAGTARFLEKRDPTDNQSDSKARSREPTAASAADA